MSDSRLLIRALLAGAEDLKRHAGLLDDINVFPVVDADTGQNLTAAVNVLMDRAPTLTATPLRDLPNVLERPLFTGASGNSGIILAQFLMGFVRSLAERGPLTPASFKTAVSAGRQKAYRAVADPKEGTMLTVMTALERLLAPIDGSVSPRERDELETGLAHAVLETKHQMTALERAGVVDSGALGFFLLASGVCLVLPALGCEQENAAVEAAIQARKRGDTTALTDVITGAIDRTFLENTRQAAETEHRYCVNLLIDAAGPVAEWRGIPGHLGSSVNVAVSGSLVKLHVHTNDPDAVGTCAATLGTVKNTVIQDMLEALVKRREGTSAEVAPVAVRVAADSALSLSRELESSLGILRLENSVNVDGRMVPDHEVNLAELLALMRQGKQFTTAQISPGAAEAFFNQALACSQSVVFIAVGRAYTGTQDTVRHVAEAHPDASRITVLDSRAASGQQAVACIAAAELAARSKRVEEVAAFAENQLASCREYLFIDDLTYLKRSGRIGKVKAAFASFLSIKPIVGHGGDGAVTVAKVKHADAAVDAICRLVLDHPGDGDLLILVEYTDNRDFAAGIRKRLVRAAPEHTRVFLSPLSSSSAVHMGPGTWGVAVTRTPKISRPEG